MPVGDCRIYENFIIASFACTNKFSYIIFYSEARAFEILPLPLLLRQRAGACSHQNGGGGVCRYRLGAVVCVSAHGGERQTGIQPKEISAQMHLTASTVTRLIEKMEHRGFLERRFIGKFTKVYPTIKSRKLDNKIHTAWTDLYKRYSDLLGESKSQRLTVEVYNATQKLEI